MLAELIAVQQTAWVPNDPKLWAEVLALTPQQREAELTKIRELESDPLRLDEAWLFSELPSERRGDGRRNTGDFAIDDEPLEFWEQDSEGNWYLEAVSNGAVAHAHDEKIYPASYFDNYEF